MRRLASALALCSTLIQASPQQLAPVQAADTLWRLATKARPDEQVAMVQVVYALWQANPHAFNQSDINALRIGSVLQIPARSQMLAIPLTEARQWYHQAIAGHTVPPALSFPATSAASSTVLNTSATTVTPAQATATVTSAAPPPIAATAQNGNLQPPASLTQTSATPAAAADTHWTDNLDQDYRLTLQQRYYPQSGAQGQANAHSSVAFSAEWAWQSDDRQQQLVLQPLLRWDQRDEERNLVDLQQAYWQYIGNGFDVKAGVDIVFWGVTESQHLVDVINQTDLVASVDGEAKLGQPMLNWNLYGDGGTLALYLLPYFRERTLAGTNGRLRLPWPVEHDNVLYESAQEQRNPDFALRWSRQFGAMDLALSYFAGNNREPVLQPTARGTLQPQYLQMQQFGLEAQAISGSWIWKLESIYRSTREQDFVAATFGFEYTQVGLFDTNWDLGWIAEYQYDSRDKLATAPGQNDVFIGGRFVANDAAGSEILLGLVQDLDNSSSQSGKLEASMRLTNNLRLRLDAWFFSSSVPGEALYFIRRDDYLQLSLDYYF